MRFPLPKVLRRQLENTVKDARDIAEQAAREALERLSVGEKAAADYLDAEQRQLRNRLRAHGRQLGDLRKPDGSKDAGAQGIERLVTEVAYEHWHRMLFARFLAENHLLMYEDGVTPLAIEDCFDLAEEETGDRGRGWQYAAKFAALMLPQIFRTDSPVFAVDLAPNHQKQLEQLLANLAPDTFQATDSLGWVYQFWQAKHKDVINKSGVKIGADELPAVTQLFTEPYMVSFLLHNSLGAWWQAHHSHTPSPVTLTYLRTTKEGKPAAGSFDAWPKQLGELKVLDPCCGSGHFLVAAFLMLVPMRMVAEGLNAAAAVDAVLRDNIHGLELDQRCVELAVFALALEAWRYPDAGGYRPLPEFQLACSGLSVGAAKDEWRALAKAKGVDKPDKKNLGIALEWMHSAFQDAPILGSLLNPAKSDAAKIVQWQELSATLAEALQQEQSDDQRETAVAAQGLAKAATLLAGQYHWVITNVPYLARGKQEEKLAAYCEKHYPAAKNDLATVFLDRCLDYCVEGGTTSVVLPQNWLFLSSYKKFREKLLKNDTWHLIARLGAQAFQTPMWDFNVQLITLSRGNEAGDSEGLFAEAGTAHCIAGLDVSEPRTAAEKAEQLITAELKVVEQAKQLENPDSRVVIDAEENSELLSVIAHGVHGFGSKDSPRFFRQFWEMVEPNSDWQVMSTTVGSLVHFGGKQQIVYWQNGNGLLAELGKKGLAIPAGEIAWRKKGVAVSQMSSLPATIHTGEIFDKNVAVVLPHHPSHIPSIWCFCSSPEYNEAVRRIDQKLNVTNATLVKVPFDLDRWQKVAEQKYPNGLPEPYTDDPTQWIFHGHPCGSVIWDETLKWTAKALLRTDDTVLQVAVARLLGYRWPAELDASMELAGEQRFWVAQCKALAEYVDDDGIVCLSAVRGEKSAAERLESLLQAAYGDEWSTSIRNKLLEAVSCKNKSLDFWLREKFFEQHCKLFQNRPFIWHIWDGLKDGFSALVNYHQLNKKNLERLIYTYLDDWIRNQRHQLADELDGAQERLNAAENLKRRLEQILQGEAPYDIFIRWKPLDQQPIGWEPDLNDGVRMNIRPFLSVEDVNKKGAGVLRTKPNIKWNKDRGKDVESAPWYSLGLQYGEGEGARINDHHLSLAEKQAARK
ncbi:N-6 DNA methylase [Pseudomaricurvus alcaniphilus]|uniref:Eco57I restriction-modification methylase domain-containing protein n=1 Tax=Pseudomaricurvus alcaniphilus TaxID=1166482 RepID=UPI00140C50BE|nr:N-6 DNA methylase [Pseudomaricurvus alcaniphilus]NHN36562.1 N-6 DNA methylase [Pseudomaricurvus alcaniphilus]